jgi:hypothetical protein
MMSGYDFFTTGTYFLQRSIENISKGCFNPEIFNSGLQLEKIALSVRACRELFDVLNKKGMASS